MLIKNRKRLVAAAAATAIMALGLNLSVQAAIMYVDVTDGTGGNTYEPGGSPGDTLTSWLKRTSYGNSGTIYQGGYSGESDQLTTEVTGITDGTYEAWVFFWDASNANIWSIAAGLVSGNLTDYSHDGPGDTSSPVAASTLSFVANPMFTESDRVLYGVNLGQATVSGGGSLNVYVDNYTPVNVNTRSWYDGVGYEAIVPEPSTMLLVGLGLAGVCCRRRMK